MCSGARGGETHQLLFWQDLPVRSEFLAAPSLAFANRRQTWGEVVEGPGCAVLGLGWNRPRRVGGDGTPGPIRKMKKKFNILS